tara:strand:+ start:179 stop:346 length:168 start_codon:yes stop_codon:yes gene_type:complete
MIMRIAKKIAKAEAMEYGFNCYRLRMMQLAGFSKEDLNEVHFDVFGYNNKDLIRC